MAEQLILIQNDGSLQAQTMPQDPLLDSIGRVADSLYEGAVATADAVRDTVDKVTSAARSHPRVVGALLATSLTLGIGLEANSTAAVTLPQIVPAAREVGLDTQLLSKSSESKTGGIIKGGSIVAGAGVIAGTAYWAVNKITSWGPNINVNLPHLITPQKPPKIETAVHQETLQITEKFEVQCNTKMSVDVGVKGDNDGGNIHLDAHIRKLEQVDFVLCGTLEVPLTIYKDNVNGITKIEGVMPTLVPSFPDINANSPVNCANLDDDATQEQIDTAVAAAEAKIAAGKKVDCDAGAWQDDPWYVPVALESDYVDDMITYGNSSAKIAAVLDTRLDAFIEPRQKDFEEQFLQHVRGIEGVGPQTVIDIKAATLTDDQKIALRVESVSDLLNDFLPVDPAKDISVDEDGVRTLRLVGTGGQEIFIKLTGNWQITDNSVFEVKPEEDTKVTKIINADGTITEVPAGQANPTESTAATIAEGP